MELVTCICENESFCYVDCVVCNKRCPRYFESMMQWTMIHYMQNVD